MPKLGKRSKDNLATCHVDLQRLIIEAIRHYDFSVICGHRGEKEQNEAFDKGTSQLKYPFGNHNCIPSLAVDIAPYPIDWKDLNRFHYLAGVVLTIAEQLRLNIGWGGNWKKLKDYPHFELIEHVDKVH